MTIKLEEMFSEIQQAGITTDKDITTSGAISAATQTLSGAATFSSAVTVNASLTVTGSSSLVSPVGIGNAGIKVGSLSGNLNPTGTTGGIGCLFINSSAGATGVTNRIYINTDGATGWTYIQTGA